MKNKTTKSLILKKVLRIVLAVVMMSSVMFGMVACVEEEVEIDWWDDFKNMEIVLYDERSEEKSISYILPGPERIEFNYVFKSEYEDEYIPSVKILHKGEEKEFYTYVNKREFYYLYEDGYAYDDPQNIGSVSTVGAFRVSLRFYVDEEYDVGITSTVFYVNVHKGEIL